MLGMLRRLFLFVVQLCVDVLTLHSVVRINACLVLENCLELKVVLGGSDLLSALLLLFLEDLGKVCLQLGDCLG